MGNFENVITPWGKSQGGSLFALGITIYHTAGHGGIKVLKKLNDKIPAAFRNADGWYEEDCDSTIPLFFHYDYIKQYCLENGLDGWSVSAEEYFHKFTKEYFEKAIQGNFPAAYAVHFNKTYTDLQLKELSHNREEFEKSKAYILRKIATLELNIKNGDTIIFDEPIRFSNGAELQEFTFERRNNFIASNGLRVRISHWKNKLYRMHRGEK